MFGKRKSPKTVEAYNARNPLSQEDFHGMVNAFCKMAGNPSSTASQNTFLNPDICQALDRAFALTEGRVKVLGVNGYILERVNFYLGFIQAEDVAKGTSEEAGFLGFWLAIDLAREVIFAVSPPMSDNHMHARALSADFLYIMATKLASRRPGGFAHTAGAFFSKLGLLLDAPAWPMMSAEKVAERHRGWAKGYEDETTTLQPAPAPPGPPATARPAERQYWRLNPAFARTFHRWYDKVKFDEMPPSIIEFEDPGVQNRLDNTRAAVSAAMVGGKFEVSDFVIARLRREVIALEASGSELLSSNEEMVGLLSGLGCARDIVFSVAPALAGVEGDLERETVKALYLVKLALSKEKRSYLHTAGLVIMDLGLNYHLERVDASNPFDRDSKIEFWQEGYQQAA